MNAIFAGLRYSRRLATPFAKGCYRGRPHHARVDRRHSTDRILGRCWGHAKSTRRHMTSTAVWGAKFALSRWLSVAGSQKKLNTGNWNVVPLPLALATIGNVLLAVVGMVQGAAVVQV